jgi:hypothetical protein
MDKKQKPIPPLPEPLPNEILQHIEDSYHDGYRWGFGIILLIAEVKRLRAKVEQQNCPGCSHD